MPASWAWRTSAQAKIRGRTKRSTAIPPVQNSGPVYRVDQRPAGLQLISMQETLYEVSGHVATITLNRPEKLNAWTRLMEQEIRQTVEQAVADDEVRVIVLTGAGRGFCAGADMSLLNSVVQRGIGNEHPLPDSQGNGAPVSQPELRPDF